jgi:hypothetical protein
MPSARRVVSLTTEQSYLWNGKRKQRGRSTYSNKEIKKERSERRLILSEKLRDKIQ